jgi:hypothetical protein
MFIKNSIEKHTRVNIVDTRFIYRYDPLNQINIHKYIDGKEQIVVIVKLINGFYLAGYA